MISRRVKDIVAQRVMFLLCIVVLSLVFLITFGLYQKAKPILTTSSIKDLIFSTLWHPVEGEFGLASFILGTLWVTTIAMLISVPLSILTAIFLSEYAPKKIRELIKPIIDLLAGISPVIYGMWGVIVIVPLVRDYLMPFLSDKLPFFPFVSNNYTGFSALAGGIVLAIMISPIIISIVEEVMQSVSFEIREVSLAIGATKWQTIKHVVLRKASPGIIAAIILALSRAFGETMAVLMVAGGQFIVFLNLFLMQPILYQHLSQTLMER